MGQLKMINDVLKKKISNVLRPQILPRQGRPSADKRTISTGAVDVEQLLEQRARGILEAQFHFLMAKDYNRATEVAVILGKDLLNLNYVDEFLKNLDKIELSNISDEYNMDLQILKGDAQHVLGNLNHAIDLYNEALAIAENEGNKPKLAELYCKLGSINEKLNEYKVAIEYLNKSLEISKTMGDAKSLSDAYGSLGDVYWKLSEFDKSNDFYSRCLESAETMTDLPGKAKIFLSLGIQSAKHGQFEESLKHYERCLDILEKGKGLDGMNYGQFYESLGDHYLKTIFSYFIQENGKGK
jgi:tetratricopeptide (TPR) repeat protein